MGLDIFIQQLELQTQWPSSTLMYPDRQVDLSVEEFNTAHTPEALQVWQNQQYTDVHAVSSSNAKKVASKRARKNKEMHQAEQSYRRLYAVAPAIVPAPPPPISDDGQSADESSDCEQGSGTGSVNESVSVAGKTKGVSFSCSCIPGIACCKACANKKKAYKRRKALKLLRQRSNNSSVYLDVMCMYVFREFMEAFMQASKHICTGKHCPRDHGCKFTGVRLLSAFEMIVMMAGVNRDCRNSISRMIEAAQISRLAQFRKELSIFQSSAKKNMRILPPFLTQTGIGGVAAAAATGGSSSDTNNESNDNKPKYIPLFQAVFGILWKFGDWAQILANKTCDCSQIPQMSKNSELPKVFS